MNFPSFRPLYNQQKLYVPFSRRKIPIIYLQCKFTERARVDHTLTYGRIYIPFDVCVCTATFSFRWYAKMFPCTFFKRIIFAQWVYKTRMITILNAKILIFIFFPACHKVIYLFSFQIYLIPGQQGTLTHIVNCFTRARTMRKTCKIEFSSKDIFIKNNISV